VGIAIVAMLVSNIIDGPRFDRKDYKIDSTNSTVGSFKTARRAGDHTPFAAAVVVDMGVFGPDGLSERNLSYTSQNITWPLKPKEHTTIEQLVKSASSYAFVLHPGKFRMGTASKLVNISPLLHFQRRPCLRW